MSWLEIEFRLQGWQLSQLFFTTLGDGGDVGCAAGGNNCCRCRLQSLLVLDSGGSGGRGFS